MVQLIRKAKTQIITKNGEVELSISVEPIVLEVNVNIDGIVTNKGSEIKAQSEDEDDPKVMVAPDFGKNTFGIGKIKFGKNT